MFQSLLCVANAALLYRFLKYSLDSTLALFLSLIFLVSPVNSQVAFSIPAMNNALFFFFGMFALCLLIRFHSARSLFVVVACLFLSLLSKETGILFTLMALIYLFWWDRQRLFAFISIVLLPIALYLMLKANAVGLNNNPNNAPIDALGLGSRLLTVPSIVLFYISKIVWPVPLATDYYWVHPTFSFQYFVLPIVLDLAFLALIVVAGRAIRNKGTPAQHRTFWFFAAWLGLGLLAHLQIIPLDETVSETYLYFPIVGLLGMIGLTVSVLTPRIDSVSIRTKPIDRRVIIAVGSALLLFFGLRTAVRGTNYSSQATLAYSDIGPSPDDYNALINVGDNLLDQGRNSESVVYFERSIDVFPTYAGYRDLGIGLTYDGDYAGAMATFYKALTYSANDDTASSQIYEGMGKLTLVYGDFNSSKNLIDSALSRYPQDSDLWLSLAVLLEKNNENTLAKQALGEATYYGQVPAYISENITLDHPFTINFIGTGKMVSIP
jgi:tetratricopeptide (TPR) repeat protein